MIKSPMTRVTSFRGAMPKMLGLIAGPVAPSPAGSDGASDAAPGAPGGGVDAPQLSDGDADASRLRFFDGSPSDIAP